MEKKEIFTVENEQRFFMKSVLNVHVHFWGKCTLLFKLYEIKEIVYRFLEPNNANFILPHSCNTTNLRCRFIQEDNWRVVDQFKSNRQTFPLSA
jgi:hypothetical protein